MRSIDFGRGQRSKVRGRSEPASRVVPDPGALANSNEGPRIVSEILLPLKRTWKRQFLGYSVTHNLKPRLRVSPKAVKRLKSRLRPVLKAGRGRRLQVVIAILAPKLRGWITYYQLASVKADLVRLDAWLRRKLRCIVWRQWKNSRTRFHKLLQYGANRERAARAAWNGRGPWWNAGASHMNLVIPNGMLRQLGLISLLDERWLSETVVSQGLCLRRRSGGEEIQLPGQAHTRKLKKLLQEEGILPWHRQQLPLIYSGGQLVAVADLWIAAGALAEKGWAIHWRNKPDLY